MRARAEQSTGGSLGIMENTHEIKSIEIGNAILSYEMKGTKVVAILRGKDGKVMSRQIRSPRGLEQSVNMFGMALWVAKNIVEPKSLKNKVTRSALTAATKRELEIAKAIT